MHIERCCFTNTIGDDKWVVQRVADGASDLQLDLVASQIAPCPGNECGGRTFGISGVRQTDDHHIVNSCSELRNCGFERWNVGKGFGFQEHHVRPLDLCNSIREVDGLVYVLYQRDNASSAVPGQIAVDRFKGIEVSIQN